MRSPIIAVFFCILLTAFPAWGKETGQLNPSYALKAAQLFQSGVEKWYAGDSAGAVRSWEDALVFDPNLEEAHYNIGVALRDQEILDRRETCLSREDVLECLGAVSHLSERPATELEKALRYLKDAVRLNPSRTNAVYMKAVIEGQLKRYDAAETSFSNHLEQYPNDAEIHYLLCAARRAQGKLEEAARSCKSAAQYRPGHVKAHHLLGSIYLELQRSGDAAAAFQKAVVLRPRSTATWFNLGLARAENGQEQEAIDAYKRALDFAPDNGAAHLNLGVVYDSLDEGSLAIRHTRQAQRIFSESGEWRQAAQAEKNIGRFLKKYWGLAHKNRLF
ncbi:MAG: tetratricopeptide repeat protein [Nitrospina sp.]|nr:tetratricopeptide repeat protein [Nitrospina sp.]